LDGSRPCIIHAARAGRDQPRVAAGHGLLSARSRCCCTQAREACTGGACLPGGTSRKRRSLRSIRGLSLATTYATRASRSARREATPQPYLFRTDPTEHVRLVLCRVHTCCMRSKLCSYHVPLGCCLCGESSAGGRAVAFRTVGQGGASRGAALVTARRAARRRPVYQPRRLPQRVHQGRYGGHCQARVSSRRGACT